MSAMPLDADSPAPATGRRRFLGLAIGSTGVVYGDIGTSPLYAFKESISHLRGPGDGLAAGDILGVVSLMFWALMVVVTLKYVFILMRFDNRGEGGTLALMALVRKAGGRGAAAITLLGMLGAGMFFGDAMLTPAISVLSAVEGLKGIDGLTGRIDPFIVPLALAILIGLFAVQRHGAGGVGRWFGPICLVWFIALGALGVTHILQHPQVLGALNPVLGAKVLLAHPGIAALILGSVFLTVTGAEALYADMGHFGQGPIRMAWLALVFPALTLNYLGQGALVLGDAAMAANPFFGMAPEALQLPLVILATAATVIASQAVISGAFSMGQQAIQLGLLPRMTLTPTSQDHAGQIYAPQINGILMIGVAALVLGFGSSSALASAYGMSVVGAMITSSLLAVVAIHRLRKTSIAMAILIFAPFLLVEAVFVAANGAKLHHGGWISLVMAAALVLVMISWVRGSRALAAAERRDVGIHDVLAMLATRPPMRAKGTAVFLTADPEAAPAALLHNLKHNQVLHEQLVLLTVKTTGRPAVADADRVALEALAPGVWRLTLSYGFMERPNISRGLVLARARGLKADIMRTSFFVSRRTLLAGGGKGLERVHQALFLFLVRNAVRAADYFQIPPSRVVELGAQVTL